MAILFYLLLLFLNHSTSISADALSKTCSNENYTTNSTYQTNLNLLLTRFTSRNSAFATSSAGSAPDSTYGLVLCRGDVGSSDCSSCIQNAAQDVLALCPNSKEATIWYDNCELRYSNQRFFSSFETSIYRILHNTQNVTDDVDSFINLQSNLLDKVMYQAAYKSSMMFATGTAVNGSDVKLNGLAQCTRDLSMDSCSRCLEQIRGLYKGHEKSQGGRVLAKSCNFRYELYRFYEGKPTVLLNFTPALPPTPALITPPPSFGEGSKNNGRTILRVMIPLVVVMMLIIVICIFFWRKIANKRKRSNKSISNTANLEEISSISLSFDLSTLKIATDYFSQAKKLGEGGFGSVYKGKLAHEQEIAVKRLSTGSTQGLEELKNELFLVAKLQHRNLVKLLGVCIEGDEKLLVYEYMPNRSLDNILFDPVKCKQLNWERRFHIIGGIARGLFYLHEESHLNAIHRDLKTSNILLDADMNPKISDFGLAKLFIGDETQGMTSRVVGTFGYMAPEYAIHGHFSTKVDVFSYGVLLIEIITGRKCSSFYDSERAEDFFNYIWKHWRKGTIIEIIDPTLENYSTNEVLRCIHIALLCVQEVPNERPPMSAVVLMLHSPSFPLQAPSQPRIFHGIVNSNSNILSKAAELDDRVESTGRALQISVNDVSITELFPR